MPLTHTTSGLRRALRTGTSLVLIPLAAIAADGDNPLTTPGAARPDFLPPPGAAFQLPPVAAPAAPSPAAPGAATLRFDRAVFFHAQILAGEKQHLVVEQQLLDLVYLAS